LKYPELDLDSRRKVWKTFLRSLQVDTHEISSEYLDSLARLDMNGRQIKNAVKMAGLLASSDSGGLNAGHIATVLRILKLTDTE
jgi:hypothetical protein